MKKLNKNQWVAVASALVLVTYLVFSGPIMKYFNPPAETAETVDTQISQSGVNVEELALGEGDLAETGDVLTVNYVGTLPDGKVFDSSIDRNTPIDFTLGVGQVIRGWDEGLVGMRVGGRRRLTIAPEYGYGEQAIGTIPPNSTLIFEVELLDAKKPASQ